MSTATLAIPKQLMLAGLSRAEASHKQALDCARFVAELLGADGRLVSADSVFEYIDPKALGNSAGAIFRDGPWEPVGFKRSNRLERQCGTQRIWRLRGNRR